MRKLLERIRWRLFRIFGPSDLKHMVKHIESIWETGYDTAIYPMGEFPFAVKTSNEDDLEPMVFPTPQERAAFQFGLNYGVNIMGGTTTGLTKEDYDELTEMEKRSTHSAKNQRNN